MARVKDAIKIIRGKIKEAEKKLQELTATKESYERACVESEDYNEEWEGYNDIATEIECEELSHKITAYEECIEILKSKPGEENGK